jgi:uncharacterized phage-associated protein
MTTASAVARHIINTFEAAGDPISNLKLQKLLYYVQGWHLATYGEPAFNERLEAWVHGPVQPGVYGEYKHYRWKPICDPVECPKLDDKLVTLVAGILDAYGGESGYGLEIRTHREAPWIEARNGIPPDQESNAVISHDSMRRFFTQLCPEGEETRAG